MKKTLIITIVLLLVGGLIVFKTSLLHQKKDNLISIQETSDEEQNNPGFIVFETDENESSKVIIKGYYDEPISLRKKDTVVLQGIDDSEYIEFIVKGEIKNFKHIELKWNENNKELIEKQIINKIDNLNNQTIVIKTYMPEGIPSEKIKWESASGKLYEFLIAEYNLDE